MRLLELADHAALVAAAYEDEREALLGELEASKRRLLEAQDAAAAAQNASHLSGRQLATLESELLSAR